MPPPISSQVLSLGLLIKQNPRFVVPRHQRNYAWDEEEYGKFWDDISSTFAPDVREYFLGSIVITRSGTPDLIVVDGQQRLITTTIMLAALRQHLTLQEKTEEAAQLARDFLDGPGKGNAAPTPRLILNQTDRSAYETNVVGGVAPDALRALLITEDLIPSNRLILECLTFMHARLGEMLKADWSIGDLYGAINTALDERVFIIRLDARDDYDAFMLFETLNDRGAELSEADLLKNHLFAIAGERIDDVQGDWEAMEENLRNERVFKLVRHHWQSTRGHSGDKKLYGDIKRAIRTQADAVCYTASLSEASALYLALKEPKHPLWNSFPETEQAMLRGMVEAMGLMRSDQILIVLLAALETDRQHFPVILRMMFVLHFRYTTICAMSPSKLLSPLIRAAKHVRTRGKAEPNEIFQKFLAQLYPPDSLFHSTFSRKAIRNHGMARYILARLNDHLSPEHAPQTRTDPLANDLEHILPKRFAVTWKPSRQDFPGGAERYVNRLGNLTLMSSEINRELGNAPFAIKRTAYARDPLPITNSLAKSEGWTADEINRRQNWMAGLAMKIWRFPRN